MKSRFARTLELLATFSGFSFLLHFAWEILQAPLYAGMREMPHVQAVGPPSVTS